MEGRLLRFLAQLQAHPPHPPTRLPSSPSPAASFVVSSRELGKKVTGDLPEQAQEMASPGWVLPRRAVVVVVVAAPWASWFFFFSSSSSFFLQEITFLSSAAKRT